MYDCFSIRSLYASMMNIKLYITVLDFEKHIIFFLHMGSVSAETGIKDRDMLYFGCDRK